MNIKPLILLGFLSGCADFPALDGTLSPAAARAAYPALVPLDPILARAVALDTAGQITPDLTAGVQSRAAALRARASRLRGPVIDAATRARMRAGVDTSALQ